MCDRHLSHSATHIYGVATMSRLLKIIRLFCRIQSLLQGSFANETYNLKEPTNRSHPICLSFIEQHICDMSATDTCVNPAIPMFLHDWVQIFQVSTTNASTTNVTFAKELYKRDEILQKRPMI